MHRRSCQENCQACGLASKSVSRLWWIVWFCELDLSMDSLGDWDGCWCSRCCRGTPVRWSSSGALGEWPLAPLQISCVETSKGMRLRSLCSAYLGPKSDSLRDSMYVWCIRPSDATKSTQSLSTTGILDPCFLRRYTVLSSRSDRGPSRDRDRKDPQGCDWR